MKKTIVFISGVTLGAHAWHEAHNQKSDVEKVAAEKAVIEIPFYGVPPHSNEPGSPSGPLRMPYAGVQVTTAVASVTAADSYAKNVSGSTSRST